MFSHSSHLYSLNFTVWCLESFPFICEKYFEITYYEYTSIFNWVIEKVFCYQRKKLMWNQRTKLKYMVDRIVRKWIQKFLIRYLFFSKKIIENNYSFQVMEFIEYLALITFQYNLFLIKVLWKYNYWKEIWRWNENVIIEQVTCRELFLCIKKFWTEISLEITLEVYENWESASC